MKFRKNKNYEMNRINKNVQFSNFFLLNLNDKKETMDGCLRKEADSQCTHVRRSMFFVRLLILRKHNAEHITMGPLYNNNFIRPDNVQFTILLDFYMQISH